MCRPCSILSCNFVNLNVPNYRSKKSLNDILKQLYSFFVLVSILVWGHLFISFLSLLSLLSFSFILSLFLSLGPLLSFISLTPSTSLTLVPLRGINGTFLEPEYIFSSFTLFPWKRINHRCLFRTCTVESDLVHSHDMLTKLAPFSVKSWKVKLSNSLSSGLQSNVIATTLHSLEARKSLKAERVEFVNLTFPFSSPLTDFIPRTTCSEFLSLAKMRILFTWGELTLLNL